MIIYLHICALRPLLWNLVFRIRLFCLTGVVVVHSVGMGEGRASGQNLSWAAVPRCPLYECQTRSDFRLFCGRPDSCEQPYIGNGIVVRIWLTKLYVFK